MAKPSVILFWIRRDLRLEDNAALYHALKGEHAVLPLFIFDRNILDDLSDKADKRVNFIHQEILKLKKTLEAEYGSSLLIKYGVPGEVYQQLLTEFDVKAVFANRDYEPYARRRDKEIYNLLKENNIAFKGFKDQVIFEKNEVVKADGKPYTVFTPYMRTYRDKLNDFYLRSYPTEKYSKNFWQTSPLNTLRLEEMGFEATDFEFPGREIDEAVISNYDKTRDFPAIPGTSRLSIHLRFGTISIRRLARAARQLNDTYLNELIWRDFYQMILYHFPHTIDESFRPQYDHIRWENNEENFAKWCEGKTGYPLVDAGMRELNKTGFMHNRVRMLVASFLTKHLLIDWRWGEAYFAEKLLDFEQASNVGGWQWAAGSGVDAAPYFRIFNPSLQLEKFDKNLKYVKKWIPEYDTNQYPEPIVDHKVARERALDRFKKALN